MRKLLRECSEGVAALLVSVLLACGGGGNGSGTSGQQLQPPAFNVSGVWNPTETVTRPNSCMAGYSFTYAWTFYQQQDSNTVKIHDSRMNLGTDSVQATMSGSVMTYSGPIISSFGCVNAKADYTFNFSDARHFTGTGTLTCLDNGCTANATLTANWIMP